MSKLEFAVRCAGILFYLMHTQKDRFALGLFAESVTQWMPHGGSRRHLARVFERLVSVRPWGRTNLVAALGEAEQRLGARGLVVVFSDFMDDPEPIAAALGRIRMMGHDAIAFQVYEPAERELDFVGYTRFRDMEDGSLLGVDPLLVRREYRRQFDLHQQRMKERCLAHAFDHVLLPVEEDYDKVIGEYIRRRAAVLT